MYYVLGGNGVYEPTTLDESPEFDTGSWMKGRPIDFPVSEPLRYTLDVDYPGELLAMYSASVPLMRDDLLKALSDAGVDNLETFKAVLHDPFSKKDLKNYKAVNIVGIVTAADSKKSKRMEHNESEMIDVDFESLVIDETKTGGALMFRLAEAVNAIVVHEKVKNVIEKRKIPGMIFYGPGEWAG